MAQNEITYLRKFEGCPHIVKLYDSRIDEASQLVWMLLEFAPVSGRSFSRNFGVTSEVDLFFDLSVCREAHWRANRRI